MGLESRARPCCKQAWILHSEWASLMHERLWGLHHRAMAPAASDGGQCEVTPGAAELGPLECCAPRNSERWQRVLADDAALP